MPELGYQQILESIRSREDTFTCENPKTALGAEIGGALTTGGGSGVALASRLPGVMRAPGFVRQAIGSGLAAAPLGAINETGKLEGEKTLGECGEAAGKGAGTAAAVGAGFSTAGSADSAGGRPWASVAAQLLHDRGDELQNLIGVLRAEATHLTSSPASSFHDRTLGRAIGQTADAVSANMRRHTPADVADEFAAANEAFANLVRVERAAGSIAAEGGVFTPAQLLNAVKATDRSARKRGFARGESLMQDLADDAKSVMGRRVNEAALLNAPRSLAHLPRRARYRLPR